MLGFTEPENPAVVAPLTPGAAEPFERLGYNVAVHGQKTYNGVALLSKTPLEDGIPRAVAWFKDWRAAHPEEDRPFERTSAADEIAHGFKQPAPASS